MKNTITITLNGKHMHRLQNMRDSEAAMTWVDKVAEFPTSRGYELMKPGDVVQMTWRMNGKVHRTEQWRKPNE